MVRREVLLGLAMNPDAYFQDIEIECDHDSLNIGVFGDDEFRTSFRWTFERTKAHEDKIEEILSKIRPYLDDKNSNNVIVYGKYYHAEITTSEDQPYVEACMGKCDPALPVFNEFLDSLIPLIKVEHYSVKRILLRSLGSEKDLEIKGQNLTDEVWGLLNEKGLLTPQVVFGEDEGIGFSIVIECDSGAIAIDFVDGVPDYIDELMSCAEETVRTHR